jgi:hypothetical protein
MTAVKILQTWKLVQIAAEMHTVVRELGIMLLEIIVAAVTMHVSIPNKVLLLIRHALEPGHVKRQRISWLEIIVATDLILAGRHVLAELLLMLVTENKPAVVLLMEILVASLVKVNTLVSLLKVLKSHKPVVLELILANLPKILKLGQSVVLEMMTHALILRTQLLGTIVARVIRPALEVFQP